MITAGTFRSFLIALLLAGSTLGRSRSGAASANPPAGLPRLLFECDSAPNFTTCGMWNWNGHLYDGAWANGTIGQMSVANADPHALVIKRVDQAGVGAGLTGTYTGKWDGKQITDAKFSWSWQGKSMTFTWTAATEDVPITIDNANFGFYRPTNWYPVPLTAYTVFGEIGTTWRGSENVDYRSLRQSPMQKFETRSFPGNCGQACRSDKPRAVAAIYADGSTFGDQKAIAEIMTERNKEQRAYKALALRLCALAKQQLGGPEIVAALAKEFDPPVSAENKDAARVQAIHFAAEYLDFRASLGQDGKVTIRRGTPMGRPHSQGDTDNTVEATLKEVNDRRVTLFADPVKDKAGKPYLTDAVDEVECKLP